MEVYNQRKKLTLTADPGNVRYTVQLAGGEVWTMTEGPFVALTDGTKRMLRHEVLSADYRKQRTAFSDGTEIEVDFDANTYTFGKV